MATKISDIQRKVLNFIKQGQSQTLACQVAGVRPTTYENWLEQDAWNTALQKHVESCFKEAHVIIANYAPFAAAKLVQLTDCEKEAVARQSCLDIIELGRGAAKGPDLSPEKAAPQTTIDQETADQVMNILARSQGEKAASEKAI